MEIKNCSDQKLLELCELYGKRVLHFRRKFAGLLPEVNRRRLYEKKGCTSIFEFAAKLAGMSKEQVKRILSLTEKFSDKPILKEALTEGKISANKLARIASIATTENQQKLAAQSTLLPQKALETFVRDFVRAHKTKTPAALFDTTPEINLPNQYNISNLKLSPEVIEKLLELQDKGIDINELILKFLNQREAEIKNKKTEIAQEQTNTISRYIPVKIRHIIREEHGTKCSVHHCKKPAKILHHTDRFAISQSHNPNFLAPLCREHHLIAHSIDLNFYKKRLS